MCEMVTKNIVVCNLPDPDHFRKGSRKRKLLPGKGWAAANTPNLRTTRATCSLQNIETRLKGKGDVTPIPKPSTSSTQPEGTKQEHQVSCDIEKVVLLASINFTPEAFLIWPQLPSNRSSVAKPLGHQDSQEVCEDGEPLLVLRRIPTA